MVAYDANTLEQLWIFNVGTSIKAPPIAYSVNGKQYIAIVAGGVLFWVDYRAREGAGYLFQLVLFAAPAAYYTLAAFGHA